MKENRFFGILLVVIIGLAFFLRVYRLSGVPISPSLDGVSGFKRF